MHQYIGNRLGAILKPIFYRLLTYYGPQGWWPADGPFEIIVGAILTQNTTWGNVEKAVANLKMAGGMSPKFLREISQEDLAILIRPHPYNGAAWEAADLGEWPDVVVWPRGGYNSLAEEHRHAFFDSLYHSAAVVGINTSAMIEAAIIGRPVLSFVADRFAGTQEGTLHFHYLLPENGGFLRMARSVAEHIEQLQAVVADAPLVRRQTEHFVATFIRPHGVGRPCTPILADAIELLGQRSGSGRAAVAYRRSLGLSRLWRPVLVAANAYAYGCAVLMDPDVRRKLRKTVASKARKGARTVARAPKQIRKRVTRRRKGAAGGSPPPR